MSNSKNMHNRSAYIFDDGKEIKEAKQKIEINYFMTSYMHKCKIKPVRSLRKSKIKERIHFKPTTSMMPFKRNICTSN